MAGEGPEEIIFPSRHAGNNWPEYVVSPRLQLSLSTPTVASQVSHPGMRRRRRRRAGSALFLSEKERNLLRSHRNQDVTGCLKQNHPQSSSICVCTEQLLRNSDDFDSLHLFLRLPLAKDRSGGLWPRYCQGTRAYFCMPRAQKAGNHKNCSCHHVAGRNAARHFGRPIKCKKAACESWSCPQQLTIPSLPTSLAPADSKAGKGESLSSGKMIKVTIRSRYMNRLQQPLPRGWQTNMTKELGIARGAQGSDGAEQGDAISRNSYCLNHNSVSWPGGTASNNHSTRIARCFPVLCSPLLPHLHLLPPVPCPPFPLFLPLVLRQS